MAHKKKYKKTALQILLSQIKWELDNLHLTAERKKCLKDTAGVIRRTYLRYEKEQIEKTWKDATSGGDYKHGEDYYYKTFNEDGED